MPIYTYENSATGERVDVAMSVRQRNFYQPGWRRVLEPGRLCVKNDTVDPNSADGAVPKALRELEMTMPAREIARQSGFSIEHLKKTWQT